MKYYLHKNLIDELKKWELYNPDTMVETKPIKLEDLNDLLLNKGVCHDFFDSRRVPT